LGQAALRREQWEQLERSHCENEPTGRKVKPIMDITSTGLGKGKMVICL
jgi:hypothetical protein